MSEQTPATGDPDGTPPEGCPSPAAAPGGPPGAVQVQLRTAPRFARFTGTGALVGLLIGLALVLLRPLPPLDLSLTAAVGYLAAIGGMVGGLIGAALAVLADRRGRSRG